jgi:cyclase
MSSPSERRIGDNVRVWTFGGGSIATSYGANCGAVIGREAVLLVDPFIAPAHARLAERALRETTALPVRAVVLTHHHTDHALGAGYFLASGAEVIAHRACSERMVAEHPGLIESRRRHPGTAALFEGAEAYEPSRTFEAEMSLDLGGAPIRIFHPGHNHTPGDAVVHLPGESVVFCGDLVSNGYHVNYEDAAFENLAAGLDFLRSLGARTYVPGHGAPGGPEILDAQQLYHDTVREAARSGDLERVRATFPEHLLTEVIGSMKW